MPTYRVTYFNSRGRAEPMRWLLSYAGQEFEDRRIAGEAWQKLKPDTPFGQMPLLEVDGKMLSQSNAACRYLAKTFGLYGSNDWEAAQIDMVVDCMDDVIKPAMKYFFEKDETKKAELKKKYEEDELPTYLKNLEKFLVNAGGEYFVGNKLSWADIQYSNMISWLDYGISYDKDAFPKLTALRSHVENEPKIKAWLDKRPQTQY